MRKRIFETDAQHQPGADAGHSADLAAARGADRASRPARDADPIATADPTPSPEPAGLKRGGSRKQA
ncbi:MAG: hypothetical protein K2X74_04290, partial [Acetobacteraceae bacterium]|nr:hypothetical protein [Acetobacteraceae bacterium]